MAPAASESKTKTRKRNPEESRRRILDAAEKAFSTRGYDGARLRDIAQEAKVHHALVHHYFGDKRGLFREVLQRGLKAISTPGIETLTVGQGLEPKLTAFVGMVYDFYTHNRNLLRIIDGSLRDTESASYQVTEESLGKLTVPLMETLRYRIERAQKRGTARDDIPADALILFGFSAIAYRFIAGEGFVKLLGLDEAVTDTEKDKDNLVQYILAAMRPQK